MGESRYLSGQSLIVILFIGFVAGWLAGKIVRGAGFGIVGDIVIGIIGAFIGGFVLTLLGIGGSAGLIGSIVVAFIGAVILIAILRALSPRRTTY